MEASRTKRVTQNITYNVVNQILSLLLSFISRSKDIKTLCLRRL